MSFRIFCDICSEECKDNTFVFEATIMEMVGVDIASKDFNPQARMNKKQIQVCKACYEKNIKELIIKQI